MKNRNTDDPNRMIPVENKSHRLANTGLTTGILMIMMLDMFNENVSRLAGTGRGRGARNERACHGRGGRRGFPFSPLCFVIRALRACFSRVTGFSQLSFHRIAMRAKNLKKITKIVRNLCPLDVTFNFRANVMKNE